jgi:serine/threonine protein kinase
MVNLVGQQLGQYRLTRLLGGGGFADVYLGEQIYLGSQAAIKVLSAPLAPEARSGFLDEARTRVLFVCWTTACRSRHLFW